jgi:hypothetical protein
MERRVVGRDETIAGKDKRISAPGGGGPEAVFT